MNISVASILLYKGITFPALQLLCFLSDVQIIIAITPKSRNLLLFRLLSEFRKINMAARYFFDCSFAQGTAHCRYQLTNQIAFVQMKQLNHSHTLEPKTLTQLESL